jgi:hypothetical protein
MRIFIGANQRGDGDAVTADHTDEVAEDAEAGHHGDVVGGHAGGGGGQQRGPGQGCQQFAHQVLDGCHGRAPGW